MVPVAASTATKRTADERFHDTLRTITHIRENIY